MSANADMEKQSKEAKSASSSVERSSSQTGSHTVCPSPDNKLATDKEEDLEKAQEHDRTTVGWGEDDPDFPHNWSPLRKAGILAVISGSSLCVTCTSSVVTSTYAGLEEAFSISSEVAILGLTFFVVGLALGPAILGPLSEFYGRRVVYLGAFGLFCLFNLPIALANSFPLFVVFRFLTGVLGSAFLSVSGGSVTDLYASHEVFIPMSFYTLSPFLGPVLGPIISSALVQQTDTWRWPFRVIVIWSGVMWALIFAFAPETFAPIILTKRAIRQRKEGLNVCSQHEINLAGRSIPQTIRASMTKVFILLAREPMLLLLCLWSALLLAILYAFFQAFPIVFGELHGFNTFEKGLSFIGIAVGMLLGFATMPYWAERYRKACVAAGGVAPPEARLEMAKVGAVMSTLSMFGFAFTTYSHVHWIAPEIFSVFFGTSILFIYTSVFTFTGDGYRPVAASAMSANSFVRSIAAGALPLVTNQMYHRMGTVGASAFLAGLTALALPLPFVFSKYGARIRAKSTFTLS